MCSSDIVGTLDTKHTFLSEKYIRRMRFILTFSQRLTHRSSFRLGSLYRSILAVMDLWKTSPKKDEFLLCFQCFTDYFAVKSLSSAGVRDGFLLRSTCTSIHMFKKAAESQRAAHMLTEKKEEEGRSHALLSVQDCS